PRAEAALIVVSGRGSDGARPNRGERAAKPLRISLEIELWLVLDQRGEAYLGPARLDNRNGLLGQLGCSLGRHQDVGAVGQHDHFFRRYRVDPGEELESARVQRKAAFHDMGAELLVEPLDSFPRGNRYDTTSGLLTCASCSSAPQSRRTLVLLLVHVGNVEALDRRPGEHC